MWGLFHKPWNKDPVVKQSGFNGIRKGPGCFDAQIGWEGFPLPVAGRGFASQDNAREYLSLS